MSTEANINVGYLYPDATVTVSDLWEVYPELAGDDKEEFARQVREAADFSRKHEALHLLRDRFDAAAVDAGIDFAEEAGATWTVTDESGRHTADSEVVE